MKKYIRKLTKQSKYSYYLILPKTLINSLKWRERQKLVVRKYGQGILIKDWKKKSRLKKPNKKSNPSSRAKLTTGQGVN